MGRWTFLEVTIFISILKTTANRVKGVSLPRISMFSKGFNSKLIKDHYGSWKIVTTPHKIFYSMAESVYIEFASIWELSKEGFLA